MKKVTRFSLGCASIAALLAYTQAFAILNVYEGFDYASGLVGDTAAGGFGWNTVPHPNGPNDPNQADLRDNAAWGGFPLDRKDGSPPYYYPQGVDGLGQQSFQAATLTAPANYGYPLIGGELFGTFNYQHSWREFDATNYINGDTGAPAYFSFLFSQDNIDTFASSYTQLIFIQQDPAKDREVLRFGLGDGSLNANITGRSGIDDILATGEPISPKTSYLFVGKIVPGGASSTVHGTVYESISDLIDASETWEMSASIDLTGLVLDRIATFSGGFENGVDQVLEDTRRSHFDELRFGTTWADVTGVPEPGTYALMLGGLALGIVMWNRRRT